MSRRAFTFLRPVTVAVLCLMAVAADAARNIQPPATKQTEDPNAPTIVLAEQISGRPDRELYLDYEVEIERDQTLLTGDHGVLRQEENEVELADNIFVQRFGDQFTGERAHINLDTGEGLITNAAYRMAATKGRGTAKYIELTGDKNTVIHDGTYSTCEGVNPDWYLRASKLYLDDSINLAVAETPVLFFQSVPILFAPDISFPEKSERRSGFLVPTMGSNSKSGTQVSVPYYFNLAPNYDATLTTSVYTKRGVQLGGEVRYMTDNMKGMTYADILPDDREDKRDRFYVKSTHEHTFLPNTKYYWDFSTASDDDYPDDFSSPMQVSLQRLMLQEGGLRTSLGKWGFDVKASKYRVLQDEDAPILKPFMRLPQVTVNHWEENIFGFENRFNGEYTRFWLNDRDLKRRSLKEQARGSRLVLQNEISYPIYTGGYFVTPKVKIHHTKYNLDEESTLPKKTLTRTLPTLSLDSGLVFERDASEIATGMTQTLEPRFFYVYTPYKNQDDFPIFDAGESSAGYAMMFADNRFVGSDRISDMNSLTSALTTRYIEPSGIERMRFTIGQRYHFKDQRVTLWNYNDNMSKNRSDLLGAASGKITKDLSYDVGVLHNQSTHRVQTGNANLQWKPGQRKLLNLGYRYVRDSRNFYERYAQDGFAGLDTYYTYWAYSDINFDNEVEQVSVSGQWPISRRWHGVAQASHSIADHKIIESILGLEYNADCWALRLMAQRYPTSSRDMNTSFFVQLELKGLAQLGSNPLSTLQERIPGYEPDENMIVKKKKKQ